MVAELVAAAQSLATVGSIVMVAFLVVWMVAGRAGDGHE